MNKLLAEVVRLRQVEKSRTNDLLRAGKLIDRLTKEEDERVERLREALQRIEAGSTCTAKGVSSKHDEFCAYHVARSALAVSPDKPPETGNSAVGWFKRNSVGGEPE